MQQHPHILANPPKRQPVSGARTYKVTIQTKSTGIEKPVNSTLTYKLEIAYSNHFITFKKTDVVINHSAIPSKINELYLKTAEPLSTIEFSCTEEGNIKNLYKHDFIIKQWKRIKNQISQEFSGQSVATLVEQLDKIYTNKQNLIQYINNDTVLKIFYQSFLNDYLVYYGKKSTLFTYTGILGNLPLSFTGVETLGFKNKQLHLQAHAQLDKKQINSTGIETYFKNKSERFTIKHLTVELQTDTLLDYEDVWINQSNFTQIVKTENYNQEKIVTLQQL